MKRPPQNAEIRAEPHFATDLHWWEAQNHELLNQFYEIPDFAKYEHLMDKQKRLCSCAAVTLERIKFRANEPNPRSEEPLI